MRFWVGLFILAAMLLLVVLVVLFGGLPAFFKSTHQFTVTFPEAPGVGPGTPVRRSGVRIGEVESLTLDDQTGEVRVRLRIDKQFSLRKNEQPTLVIGLLGGDTSIDFVPRRAEPGVQPDRSPVDPGAELQGVRQATVSTLLNQASEVVPTTQEVLNDIRKSLKSIEKMTPLAEETLKEYRDLAKEARQAMPDLRELVKSAREAMPEVLRTNDEVQSAVRNWGRLGERLDVLLQANQDMVVKTIENLSKTSESLNEALTRFNGLLSEENQRNVNATLRNLRSASDNLPAMSKDADEVMKATQQSLHRLDEAVAKAQEVLNNLQTLSKPMAERGPRIIQNVDDGLGKLNQAVGDIDALVRAIGEGDGALRRFVSDPSLYNRIDAIGCQIQKMLPRVDRILQDAEVFSDKLARHPESLGLGGVVRPSSGLKDGPTSTRP
jgi:phospholipid/cholesterol/gamma-HCH transport system substrate-binding protein